MRLLFETSIREGLLEGNTINQEGVSDRTSGNLLDSDKTLIEIFVQSFNGINDHTSEEFLVVGDQLGIETGLSTLQQQISSFSIEFDFDFADLAQDGGESLSETLDQDLRVDTLFNITLGFLQEGSGQQNDGGGSITDFLILRLGNVDQSFSSRVNNFQILHNGGTIIGDDNLLTIMNQFIHTSGAEGSFDDISNNLAGIDVADNLTFSLRSIGTFFEEDNVGLQEVAHI
mmetsp:Transcript_57657/g.65792  ORF Transcript_57657/g.65792 Transcript_57657/m.65792 type:complete len:230 (+) Transcript_57657:1219-1908(+)